MFTGWQAWEARSARVDARNAANQARLESQEQANKQAEEVRSARAAAERSAAAAESLVNAMKSSVVAAQQSARTSEETLALSRRQALLDSLPNLYLVSVRLTKAIAVNDRPVVVTRISNNGKGTAKRLITRQWFSISPSIAFTYQPISPEPASVTELAGGWVENAVGGPAPLTDFQVKEIEAGRLKLFAYGRAEYEDGTPVRPGRHVLYWCGYYLPGDTNHDKLGLLNCPAHNYSEKFIK
jgi:hypothetical protein